MVSVLKRIAPSWAILPLGLCEELPDGMTIAVVVFTLATLPVAGDNWMSLPVAEVIVLLAIVKILLILSDPLVLKIPVVVILPVAETTWILEPILKLPVTFTSVPVNPKMPLDVIAVAVISLPVIDGAVKVPVTSASTKVASSPVNETAVNSPVSIFPLIIYWVSNSVTKIKKLLPNTFGLFWLMVISASSLSSPPSSTWELFEVAQ